MLGAKVRADLDILQAKTKDYDAVIFVGGSGATTYFNDQVAHMLAFQAYDTGKVTAAICAATSTLANARVLEGKRATGWPSERPNIEAKSAGYTGADVEVSGRVVTGKGPASARKFAEAIAKLLEGAQ
jgi:protease I